VGIALKQPLSKLGPKLGVLTSTSRAKEKNGETAEMVRDCNGSRILSGHQAPRAQTGRSLQDVPVDEL
jgi:hypothetical protein